MRPLTVAASVIAAGGALGAASRFVAVGDARRGMVSLVAAFGVASCVAAAWNAGGDSIATRLRYGAGVLCAAFAAAWAAGAASGSPSVLGAPAVVAGAAVVACGAATLCRSLGASAGVATFAGAALPVAAAALLFVADPFVEWRGSSTPEAPARAASVVALNPVASIADDVGVKWQRSRWMYEGPVSGTPGLSVAGRFYPSRPTDPWTWAAVAAALGFATIAAASPRRAKERLGSAP